MLNGDKLKIPIYPFASIFSVEMMKDKLPHMAAGFLGIAFLVFGLNFFFKFMPVPSAQADSPAAQFMGAMFVSGFLGFVKALEVIGGALVILPKFRRLGLMILVPIVVNIFAYNAFLTQGVGLTKPPVIVVLALTAYLLFTEREFLKKFVS